MTQHTATYGYTTSTFTDQFEAWRASLPHRSRHAILGGVCAGIAERYKLSPTLVRAAVLLASALPGPMWLVYASAWLLMPQPRRR